MSELISIYLRVVQLDANEGAFVYAKGNYYGSVTCFLFFMFFWVADTRLCLRTRTENLKHEELQDKHEENARTNV